uniref:PiggyBac transposable element-derived protein domain-containing protein n=1 Tax=Glossina palpalis gambiensis TaxID=67801 RepID=A0A1B0BNQ8_9MUSC
MQIWRMWHFCNNDLLHVKSGKLLKIREVLNYLQNKLQPVCTPQQQLPLDKAIITWRGAGATLQDTVLSISNPYVGIYHHIYMDNHCSSVRTAVLLLQRKTRICGTIRANRGFPQNLKTLILNEHESKYARKGQVVLQEPNRQNDFDDSFRKDCKRSTLVRDENQAKLCCRL